MNKSISIIRIAILCSIGLFALAFLGGEEQGNSSSTLSRILLDKALAFASIWYMVILFKRWRKIDPWLMAYCKMCDEVMENSNSTYQKD